MNAISRVPLPALNDDDDYASARVVLADGYMGRALHELGDAVGAICGQRRALTEAEHAALVRMRNAMVALSHARNLNEPLMVGRRPGARSLS